MPKIFEMPRHMADLIAAGEVVERPSSVVKELTENAIDAGASAISIEIANGGMTYIRISDDGCGMAPEDVPTAFLRHATSKVRTEEELDAIGTLGFRGEALAAIAAVARVELFTREHGASEGTYIALEGGTVSESSPVGCPEGTTIIVRDLFFNVPARHKFMKKDSAEGAAVSAAVVRCALSHPNLSVRYIRDGREEVHTPGDGRMDSCIYSVLGREFSDGLLRAVYGNESAAADGFVCAPSCARGNRSHQFFFVNGRYVKSQMLQAALEQAYKNSLFTGRFPSCVLYLKVDPFSVDVNVHPAKTEIKFFREKQVFDAVYCAVRQALDAPAAPPKLAEKPLPETPVPEVGENAASDRERRISGSAPTAGRSDGESAVVEQTRIVYGSPSAAAQYTQPTASVPPAAPMQSAAHVEPTEHVMPQPEAPKPAAIEETDWRVIGEALGTYILAERGDTLYLIDKHAAHERILFDRLKSTGHEAMSQELIAPYTVAVGREEAAVLLANAPQLEQLGFGIEDYGGGTVAVTRLPAELEKADIGPLLAELSEKLRLSGHQGAEGLGDELLASVACKAAVKAGKASEPGEREVLVGRVLSGKIKYCPHGRPVAFELTKKTLDRNFKRI